ncbi:ComF family protein [Nitrospira sp. M1]
MLEINPQNLSGNWSIGVALDAHSLGSVPIGESQGSHMQFDTTYTEVGKRIKQLKYHQQKSGVSELVETAATFIKEQNWDIDIIIPVPPSKQRREQPVMLLVNEIGAALNIPVSTTAIKKVKETSTLKNIPIHQRSQYLDGAYEVLVEEVIEQRV